MKRTIMVRVTLTTLDGVPVAQANRPVVVDQDLIDSNTPLGDIAQEFFVQHVSELAIEAYYAAFPRPPLRR